MTKFLSNINLEAANDIQFKTTAGANAGKIEQDGNNLVLSNAVGDILLGDGSSDVYIGDGTNNVDIIFEQSGSIKGDGSAVTLTIGGANTTLNLENPNINGTLTLGGATTINNKLTFTGSSGYILFDYEPSGDTGEYTTEVPLLKVDRAGTEYTILSRVSEYGALQLGHDDGIFITAGETGDTVKSNMGLTSEVVGFAAEGGYYAWGWPNNMQSPYNTWASRYEMRFRTDHYNSSASDPAADALATNGLYIGQGASTQFIDMSRNLKNIGTISSGAITTTAVTSSGHIKAQGGGNVYVYDDDDDSRIHINASSNATEGVLRVSNGANYGFIARGITNNPRIGAFHNGNLDIYGFGNSAGADHADDDLLAQFNFGGEKFLVNGEVEATTLDINGAADISGATTIGGDVRLNSGELFLTEDGSARKPVRLYQSGYKGAVALERDGVGTVRITGAAEVGDTYFNASNVNVGIGTSTPSAKLDVVGEVQATSLDINGNADISGNLTGVDTLTATTFSGDLNGTINTSTTATTQSASNNSTKVATTAYVDTAVANLIDGAPSGLQTLNELAEALNDDDDAVVTINTALSNRYTKTETDAFAVKLTGAQTIAGAKTFSSNATFTADVYVHHNDGLQIGNTGNSSTARTTLTSFEGGGNSRMKIKGGNFVHSTRFETSKNDFQYAEINSSYNGSDSTFNLYKSNSDTTGTDATTTISTGTSTFAGDIQLPLQKKLYFNNHNENIFSNVNGDLQINARTELRIKANSNGTASTPLELINGGNVILSLDQDQSATFAGDVTVGDDLFMPSGGVINFNSGDITVTHSSNKLTFDGASAIQINTPAASSTSQNLILNRPAAGTHYSSIEWHTDGTVDWSIGQNAADNFEIFENGADATTRFTIEEGGNIGIGVTDPTQKLHVDGHALISGEKYYYVNGTGAGVGSDSSGNLILRQNNADLMTTSGSNVTFAGAVTGGGNATFGSDTNSQLIAGRGKIGAYVSDYVYFSHIDYGTSSNYALKQSPTGNTDVNAPTGGTVALSINNSPELSVTSTAATFAGNIVTSGHLQVASSYPRIYLTDTDTNDDYSIINNNGTFLIYNDTDSSNAFAIAGDNNATFTGKITLSSNKAVEWPGGSIRAEGNILKLVATDYINPQDIVSITAGGNTSPSGVEGLHLMYDTNHAYIKSENNGSTNRPLTFLSSAYTFSVGNATFAGTIGSGAITSTGKITGTELEGTSLDINGVGNISGDVSIGTNSSDARLHLYDSECNMKFESSHGRESTFNQGGGHFHLNTNHVNGLALNYGNTSHEGLLALYNNTTAAITLDATGGTITSSGAITANGVTLTGDQDLSAYATLASPALTGSPTAPTATTGKLNSNCYNSIC